MKSIVMSYPASVHIMSSSESISIIVSSILSRLFNQPECAPVSRWKFLDWAGRWRHYDVSGFHYPTVRHLQRWAEPSEKLRPILAGGKPVPARALISWWNNAGRRSRHSCVNAEKQDSKICFSKWVCREINVTGLSVMIEFKTTI